MGSFEYYHTSFSYTLQETGEEKFVGVPEQGGRDLISTDPLAPGTVYTAGVTSDGTVGLYRVEVSVSSGTGKLKTGRRRRRRDEGVGPARVQLPPGEEERARHRARPRHLGPPRRGDRPARQPRRGRDRRRLLRRRATRRCGRRPSAPRCSSSAT